MNISILDKTGFIMIDDTERQISIPKFFEVIVIDANRIQIVNPSYNIILPFADIIAPVHTTILNLQSILQGFSGESSGSIGNATAGKQDAQTAILGQIKAKTDNIPSPGQALMVASLPVVIASDQSPIPVSGTISLPSGVQAISSSLEVNSTNSPVTSGATSILFTTSSDFTGTINGKSRFSSTSYSFESVIGKTLPAIAYTVTAGSMNIDKLV